MRCLHSLFAAFIIFLIVGCSGIIKTNDAVLDQGMEIRGVPAFEQAENQCGPAALASVLTWSGVDIKPSELSEAVYDSVSEGSLQISLIAAARRHGRVAYEINGMNALKDELAAGHPVLVLVNQGMPWWPAYHYVVICGFDPVNGQLLLADGSVYKKKMLLSRFQVIWDRAQSWGLLVLPPETLPATATEMQWLEAVYGLELAGRHREALSGYSSALDRWPEALGAMMGMANALHALGMLEPAHEVLSYAVENHPESGPAYNNLAHIMFELGELDAALETVLRALEIGGPHADVYQRTLKNIRKAIKERDAITPFSRARTEPFAAG